MDLPGPGNATAATFCFWRRVSMLEWAGLIPVHLKRVWWPVIVLTEREVINVQETL